MNSRNKFITYKRGNSRLLDTAFETKSIKERAKGYFSISQTYTSTQETLSNMSSFINAVTNVSTTAPSLTWNQETYNKIIHHNNKTKD